LPIVRENQQGRLFDPMPRLRPLLRLLAIPLTLGLAACAETATSDQMTSSTTLRRGYDNTLTKSEQQAVISDLENAKTKQQGETGQNGSGATTAQ
jgi:hypothetical protein